ncbi:MAG: SgcJ/EcaC family oxidoreductase [Candidatus Sericytochromatia bacterium]
MEQSQQMPDEAPLRELYEGFLRSWNRRDAAGMAALCTEDVVMVGFDGSQYDSRAEIEVEIGKIFADHPTPAFVWKLGDVRFLTPETALLRAIAGLVPPGKTDINPALNAVQSLVAVRHDELWRIALFQNTPAQLHQRPDLAEQMNRELREGLR